MRACAKLLMFAAVLGASSAAAAANAEDQQRLVDRATLAAQEVLSRQQGGDARNMLPDARAVMICPRVFKLGLIFGGGEGGGCVLLARGGQGTWSSPAFYSLTSAGVGPQLGVQDGEVVMIIRTDRGLRSVMDSQFKLGGDASFALVTEGAGVEGSTTTNLNADIVAFVSTRGLFAGFSLQGSVMSSDSGGDEAYYGQPVGPIDIVRGMRVNNPAADPLREVLMRYGNVAAAPPVQLPPPVAQGQYYQPPPQGAPPQGYAAAPPGAIQQQSLPPPQ